MLKLLLDMNLSRRLAEMFRAENIECIHWTEVGNPDDDDRILLQWAKANRAVIVSCDLDFSAILAATNFDAPSVISIRCRKSYPEAVFPVVKNILHDHAEALNNGVLISVEDYRLRIRKLPFKAES